MASVTVDTCAARIDRHAGDTGRRIGLELARTRPALVAEARAAPAGAARLLGDLIADEVATIGPAVVSRLGDLGGVDPNLAWLHWYRAATRAAYRALDLPAPAL